MEPEQYHFGFQRELRLLKASQFQRVFDKAFKVQNRIFTLLARENQLNHPRLGLIIAKKNLKQATQRNYVKRILREGFRLSQHQLPACDLIILTKRDIAVTAKTDIIRLRDELFSKLIRKCNSYSSS